MIRIRWQDNDGKWKEMPFKEIEMYSRNHAINLFSRKIPVKIKQDTQIIVNSQELYNDYRSKGESVMLLTDIKPNTGTLKSVGFIYG